MMTLIFGNAGTSLSGCLTQKDEITEIGACQSAWEHDDGKDFLRGPPVAHAADV